MNYLNTLVSCCNIIAQLATPICTAIINKNDFQILVGLAKHRIDASLKIELDVIYRNDYTYRHDYRLGDSSTVLYILMI